MNRLSDWTLSFWFNPAVITNGTLYSEGGPFVTLKVDLTPGGQLHVGVWNQTKTGPSFWVDATTTNAVLQTNRWQQLTVTLTGATDTNGTLRVYLENQSWEATNFYRLNFDGTPQAVFGASSWSSAPNGLFQGRLDQVRIWNRALTADQIRDNRYDLSPDTAGNLLANFPCDEGAGLVVHNLAGDKSATLHGDDTWCWGQMVPHAQSWADFPGYVHGKEGGLYNVNRYQ